MSTVNPNPSHGIPPDILPALGPLSRTENQERSEYPLGVTEEDIQHALRALRSKEKRHTTEEVIARLTSMESK